jgi:hypothetical protein
MKHMSTQLKRRRIRKSEEPGKVHELTDMVVEEVSLVDRAANKRKFLVTKQDGAGGGSPANDNASAPEGETIDPVAARAELDKLAAQAAQDVAVKDAADAAEAAAQKAAETADPPEQTAAPVETPAPVAASEAPVVAPASAEAAAAPATDPVEAIKALAPPVKKDAAADEEAQEQVEAFEMSGQMKAALQGSLQAVADRLAVLRSLVDGAMEVSDPSYGVPYGVYAHIEYMCSMLYGVEALGGPEWEVAAAAMTSKADGKPVKKVGRPMRKDRFERLKSAAKSLSDLINEMEGDPDEAEKRAAAAATPAPAPNQEVDSLKTMVKSLQTMVATLQRQGGARVSNVNSLDTPQGRRDTFVWEHARDMAAPARRLDRQF